MDMEEFKQRQINNKPGDDFKMVVVAILILSLIIFTALGEVNTRKIIIPWAIFMTVLMGIAVILDLIAYKKNKTLREKNQ